MSAAPLTVIEIAAIPCANGTAFNLFGRVGVVAGDHVLVIGADVVLDRGAELDAGIFTVAIDVVGVARWAAVIDALKPGGRYTTAGAIAGPIVEADLRTMYFNDLTLYGCSCTPHAVFSELIALVNTGQVKPLVSKSYPLLDIAKAQEEFSACQYAHVITRCQDDSRRSRIN